MDTNEEVKIRKPIKFSIKNLSPLKGKVSDPTEVEFPTLDELEMDVPLLNEHMDQQRINLEDEAEFEMQCLKHCSPSVGLIHLGF